MSDARVVTIDGPSGSGKGTISRALARRVHWHLLDSGALYRLVALAGLERGLEPDDISGHIELASIMEISFGTRADGGEEVTLFGRNVTSAVRSEVAGQGASRVAAWPGCVARSWAPESLLPPPGWWPTAAIWAPSSSRRRL